MIMDERLRKEWKALQPAVVGSCNLGSGSRKRCREKVEMRLPELRRKVERRLVVSDWLGIREQRLSANMTDAHRKVGGTGRESDVAHEKAVHMAARPAWRAHVRHQSRI
jgi:hypothetical protein